VVKHPEQEAKVSPLENKMREKTPKNHQITGKKKNEKNVGGGKFRWPTGKGRGSGGSLLYRVSEKKGKMVGG